MRSRDLLATVDDLPSHEVVRLLSEATGRRRSDLLIGFDVTEDECDLFNEYIERRISGEPLQYIEGVVTFGPVDLHVDGRVLVPRPETEYLFEMLTGMLDDPSVIVDLCTGSGNLALSLASTYRNADVYAVDISPDAVEVAKLNAEKNELDISILVGDLFRPLPDSIRGRVDLIVSNPPYLALSEMGGIPIDVRREPEMALLGGEEGTEVLERIAREAIEWLAPRGIIACEISEFHSDRITEIFTGYGATVCMDLSGKDRYVIGNLEAM